MSATSNWVINAWLEMLSDEVIGRAVRITSPEGVRIEFPAGVAFAFSSTPHAGADADGNFLPLGTLKAGNLRVEVPWALLPEILLALDPDPEAPSQAALSAEQEAEFLQQLSDRGVKGEIAGAALRQLVLKIAEQPNVIRFAGFQIAFRDGKLGQHGTLRPIPDIVKDLIAIREQRTALEFAAAARELFGPQALPAIFALVNAGATQQPCSEPAADINLAGPEGEESHGD